MNQQQQAPETFPLAGIAMQFLRKVEGKEPLAFGRQGSRALDVGLTALFSSGLPPTPALNELLGLALVLDEERGAPTAARLIRNAVRKDRRALAALGISTLDTKAIQRGSARLTGAKQDERAPIFGSAAPKGAQKAASMIDPMALERSRLGAKRTPPAQARPAPRTPVQEAPSPAAKAPKARRKFDVS